MKGITSEQTVVPRPRHGAFLAALVVFVLIAPAGLSASGYGPTLRLSLLDGRQIEGELLTVKGEDLILMLWSGSSARVGIGEVAELSILRKNRIGRGLTSGLLIGFAVGALLAVPSTFSSSNEYGVLPIAIAGSMGGFIGAVFGTGAGLISSSKDTIHCQDRDAPWRSAVLKRLRLLARFRDQEDEAAASTDQPTAPTAFVPRKEALKHWRIGASIIQSPPTFTDVARDFVGGIRYGDPLSPGTMGTALMDTNDGKRSWVGLRDIRIDYYLTKRWSIGIRLNPFLNRDSAYGYKTMRLAEQDMDTVWFMDITSKTHFLTTTYSIFTADSSRRKTTLRLGAGIGWNNSEWNYAEFSQDSRSENETAGVYQGYSVWSDMLESSSLSALVEAEVAHHVSSRWSIALLAGFRYDPLRIGNTELKGRIQGKAPHPDGNFSAALPATTLNIGGFYIGINLSAHI